MFLHSRKVQGKALAKLKSTSVEPKKHKLLHYKAIRQSGAWLIVYNVGARSWSIKK